MGISTSTALVKWACRPNMFPFDYTRLDTPDEAMALHLVWEETAAEMWDDITKIPGFRDRPQTLGWYSAQSDGDPTDEPDFPLVKKTNSSSEVYGAWWYKGNPDNGPPTAQVWAINESPVAHGGEIELTLIAHTKEELKEFMKDLFPGMSYELEETSIWWCGFFSFN